MKTQSLSSTHRVWKECSANRHDFGRGSVSQLFSLQNHLMRFHAFIRIQFFDTFVCASFLSQITRSHHQFPGLHSRNALLSHHSGGNHDVRNSEGSHVFCLHAVSPRSFYEMVLLSRRTCSMTICRRAMPTTTSIWSSTPIPSPRRWRTRNR